MPETTDVIDSLVAAEHPRAPPAVPAQNTSVTMRINGAVTVDITVSVPTQDPSPCAP